MKTRFDECLKFVLKWEGGYSDHPSDRGGKTNAGITQSVYDEWRVRNGLSRQPVTGLSRDELLAIYRGNYWNPVRGDDMPEPLDLVLFDSAVNCGPHQATKWLQRALGVAADGRIGPQTMGAVNVCDPRYIANRVADMRSDFYDYLVSKDPRQGVFLAGWDNRMIDLKTEIA
jgi:lysozyme family protein